MWSKLYLTLTATIFFVITVWVFYWLVYGAIHSHPNAEDLSLSHPTFSVGRWRFILNTLATYDGRFFLNIIHTLTPLAFRNVTAYPVVAIVGIALFVMSLYFFLSSILVSRFVPLFLLSLLFAAVHFIVVPSIVHQLYWMSSSLVYLWSWIFFLLCSGSVIRALRSKFSKWKNLWQWMSMLLLPAAVGTNEMMLPLICLLSLYCMLKGKENDQTSFAILFCFLASILVLFFITSPGISQRLLIENSSSHSFQLSGRLHNSILHGIEFSKYLFTHPVVIMGLLTLLLHNSFFKLKSNLMPSKFSKTPLALLIGIAFLWLITLPYYIPIGGTDIFPSRIFNAVSIYSIMIAVIVVINFRHRIPVFPKLFNLPIVILFLCSATTKNDNNIQLIIKEKESGLLDCYDKEMKFRGSLLRNNRKKVNTYRKVNLDKISCVPQSIYYPTEIEPNRTKAHWNSAYELYYDIDEVMLQNL